MFTMAAAALPTQETKRAGNFAPLPTVFVQLPADFMSQRAVFMSLLPCFMSKRLGFDALWTERSPPSNPPAASAERIWMTYRARPVF